MKENSTPTSEDEYLKRFERHGDSASTIHQAHSLALDIRKFEIELYWKRAAYFWVFTGAALAGFLAALTGKDIENRPEALLLTSCIGLLFATAWYFVNRASKYWQLNWEFHVDLLENKALGPLYKTVLETNSTFLNLGGPYRFSVSKINQWLSFFVAISFSLLITFTLLRYYKPSKEGHIFPLVCIGATVIAIIVLTICGRVGNLESKVNVVSRETKIDTKDG